MPTPSILLLALGNDLLGDDGVGLAVARALRPHFSEDSVEITESGEAGLALMELMTGFEKTLIVDSIQTKECPPGTVLEYGPDDFRKVIAPSPHYAGLPEILSTAERLSIPFPKEICVLAMEVENPYDFQEHFTPLVEQALNDYIDKAKDIISGWC